MYKDSLETTELRICGFKIFLFLLSPLIIITGFFTVLISRIKEVSVSESLSVLVRKFISLITAFMLKEGHAWVKLYYFTKLLFNKRDQMKVSNRFIPGSPGTNLNLILSNDNMF